MGRGDNLKQAKINKNDEFYTQYEDIEKEIQYYTLKGMRVYCPCDDYRWSNFVKYFKDNFQSLGITKLIATNYDIGEGAWKYTFDGTNETIEKLNGNGDFRSEESIAFLKEADVVVTNPPFSLFREYIKQLMDYNKKFIVLSNNNAITYKEFFPYIKEGKVWLGRTLFTGKMPFFKVPDDYPIENERFERREDGLYKQVNAICWFTNIEHEITGKPVILTKSYYDNPEYYPKYDNYDAINVDKVKDIPIDYDGVMGVPITFLDKYFNSEFQIIDGREIALNDKCRNKTTYLIKDADSAINGKPTYARILIKKIDFEIVGFRKGNDDKDLSIDGYTPYFRILIKKKLEFEIIGLDRYVEDNPHYGYRFTINGKEIYARILIKRIS